MASLPEVISALKRTSERLNGEAADKIQGSLKKFRATQQHIELFVSAYRQYSWTVESLEDLKLAPFHLLATEGNVHINQNDVWHMETLAAICREDPGVLLATEYRTVQVTDPTSEQEGTEWWTSLTGRGGEGRS